jgi:hypothetical protein
MQVKVAPPIAAVIEKRQTQRSWQALLSRDRWSCFLSPP